MSAASCTELLHSMPKPVDRQAITSLWSPKMDRAWMLSARALTWNTAGSSSPASLYMLGIISSRPWLAVKVHPRAPPCISPWSAPAAPASDCIWITRTVWPKRFFLPRAAHSSTSSAMGLEGVMG